MKHNLFDLRPAEAIEGRKSQFISPPVRLDAIAGGAWPRLCRC
jgi:hypothetical protein